MNRPCPTTILCDDANPFANLSSEGPEPFWVPPQVAYWTRTGYCCDKTTLTVFSRNSAEDAEELLARTLETTCPKCDEPKKFCADASCPDGSNLSRICVPTSQADADALAALAAGAMLPFCDTKEDLFRADCACPDGSDPHTVLSSVSEAVAKAQCDFIPKNCGTACNAEQSCMVRCTDGTRYTCTVPACTIVAETVDIANVEAYALACSRAQAGRVCLGPIPKCACEGQAYSAEITASGTTGTITWSSSGLPAGLALSASASPGRVVLSGTPTAYGHYTFDIIAHTGSLCTATRTYDLSVIKISTTSLPAYTPGQPYSVQLQALGGSGNYSWSIRTGTLPTGLTLSSAGLISGTPTSGGGAITFDVVDLSCEQANDIQFPPAVKMTTASLTRMMRWLGWQAFTFEPRRFKKLEWSGTSEQWAITADPTSRECARAKYEWSGASEITQTGVQISSYTKNFFQRCPTATLVDYPMFVVAAGGIIISVNRLKGYCFAPDPQSVSPCQPDGTTLFSANVASDSVQDYSDFPRFNSSANITTTGYSHVGSDFMIGVIGHNFTPPGIVTPPVGFPLSTLNGITAAWTELWSNHNYQGTLSEEYTDTEAFNNATVYASNSNVAENRTRNFTSPTLEDWFRARTTSVIYSLTCSHLIVGRDYTVDVSLIYSTGAIVKVTTTFTATDTTHTIAASVPTPAPNTTIKVAYPHIVLVPLT